MTGLRNLQSAYLSTNFQKSPPHASKVPGVAKLVDDFPLGLFLPAGHPGEGPVFWELSSDFLRKMDRGSVRECKEAVGNTNGVFGE